MPGTWRVPVSRQSHSRAPPGKTLASLKRGWPSTSMWPQDRCEIRGELDSTWLTSFNRTSLVQNKEGESYPRRDELRTHVATVCQRTLYRLDLGHPLGHSHYLP